jgi:hypothetical protein
VEILQAKDGRTVTLSLSADGTLREVANGKVRVQTFEHYYLGIEVYGQRVSQLLEEGYHLDPSRHEVVRVLQDNGEESAQGAETLLKLRALGEAIETCHETERALLQGRFDQLLQASLPELFPEAPNFENWYTFWWRRGGIEKAIGWFVPESDTELSRLEDELELERDSRIYKMAWRYVTRALLRHPCAANLQDLDLRLVPPYALDAFRGVDPSPSLKSISTPRLATSIQQLSALSERIEQLSIAGISVKSAQELRWPSLLRLTVDDEEESETVSIETLLRAAPRLQRLTLQGARDLASIARDLEGARGNDVIDTVELGLDVAASDEYPGLLREHERVFRKIPCLVIPHWAKQWAEKDSQWLFDWENITWK